METELRLRAYKTKLRLNNRERTWCRQCAGAARWCYNWGLAAMSEAKDEGRKTGVMKEKKRLNKLKHEDPALSWLPGVKGSGLPYVVLESAFDNLNKAFENFFRRVREKDPKPGYPTFKSRKNGIGGFTVRGGIHVTETKIRLPTIGWLRLQEHGYLPTSKHARILSATISESAGDWFVSLQVEETVPVPNHNTGDPMGVDLGLHVLAACSDGTMFENPRPLIQAKRKLARLNRELARRKKGGQNWKKTRAKLARAHRDVRNIRRHHQHELSHYVTAKTKPRAVVVEDLNVKGMMSNHSGARATADVGMGEIRRQIEYKAGWYGSQLVVADRWFPSSKTCSGCGAVKKELGRGERTYICENCGLIIDRDLNAAINLARLAE